MKNITLAIKPLSALLAILVFLGGCATSANPIVIPPASVDTVDWKATGKNIYLMEPMLKFSDVYTESPISPADHNGQHLVTTMMEFAREQATQHGFSVLSDGDINRKPDTDILKTLSTLQLRSTDLARRQSRGRERLLTHLHDIRKEFGTDFLCVQVLKVKVGSGSSWDPNSGQIKGSSSTSELEILLIDTDKGTVSWRSKVFYRSLPNDEFDQILDAVYATFPARTGGNKS